MRNKKFNKLHLFWIIPACLLGLLFVISMFTVSSAVDCAESDLKLIANLEQGILDSCTVAKSGGTISVMSIELLESMGNNESSEFRPFWEGVRDMDCNEVLNNYRTLN